MNNYRIPGFLALSLLAVTSLTPVLAAAENYQQCRIEYHISLMPDENDNVDTSPSRHEYTACVRNLEDCNSRAMQLVRDHEMATGNVDRTERPNLNTIRISGTIIEGTCSELD